ncbi:STAS domain-containing protein [Streptomyces sp. NPDC089915]|uniref:STAS domain-containing protein n=1 Tax=Streptomyces sp. NPDC089915 TaxID=3155186 RepID=UPI0034274009
MGMPGTEGERFSVAVRTVDGTVLLTLGGELDHDTAEPLRQALEGAAARGGRLVVDMAGLRFCDSTGLNALLHGRIAVEEAGGSLELAGLGGPVARMFRITGADTVFPVHSDVTRALGGKPGP